MVFHWSFSDSKSPQVYMTLLSILADLNNAVVWMVSTRPLISKSFSPWTNFFSDRVERANHNCFMFHSFFSSLARPKYLSLFSLSFSFTLWSTETIWQVLFLVDYHWVWSRLGDPFESQNTKEVFASHFPAQILGCAYTICSCGQI